MARRRYVEKTNVVSYGPHGRANLADIWRRRDLPRDGKAPVLLQVPGGAWVIGMRRPQAYPLMSHLAARGWVCVSIELPGVPACTPGPTTSSTSNARWPGSRRTSQHYGGDPEFRRDHRRFRRRPSVCAGGADPQRPQVPAGLRRRRHVGGRRRPVVRALRLVLHRGDGPSRIRRICSKSSWSNRNSPPTATSTSMPRRSGSCAPTRHRFSSCTATDDSLIPVGEAGEFVEELRAVSKSPVAYAELPNAQHAFDIFGSPRAHQVRRGGGPVFVVGVRDESARVASWVRDCRLRPALTASARLLQFGQRRLDGDRPCRRCRWPPRVSSRNRSPGSPCRRSR